MTRSFLTKIIPLFAVLATIVVTQQLPYSKLEAGSPNVVTAGVNKLNGWAWSSNIGWINFDTSSGANGSGSNSYVGVDNNGNISGYAWSSNIGWIQFGGLSNFPGSSTGKNPNTNDLNAYVSTSSGAVSGWARACTGTLTGDCSKMNSRRDGWDGWIELSGNSHQTGDKLGKSGVTYVPPSTSPNNSVTKGIFVGYAWGGDVVGWISFNPTLISGITCPGGCGNPGGYNTLSVSCMGSFSQNGVVTYNAVPNGGSGRYDYSWNGGAWTSQSYYSNGIQNVNGAVVNGPSVTVRDHNQQSITAVAAPSCPDLTVTIANDNFNLLSGLQQGSVAVHNTSNPLIVKKGQPFALVRTINLSPRDAYNLCVPKVTKVSSSSGNTWSWTFANLDPSTKLVNGDKNRVFTESGIDTSENDPGTYHFEMTCQSTDSTAYPQSSFPAKTTSTWVRLESVNEGER